MILQISFDDFLAFCLHHLKNREEFWLIIAQRHMKSAGSLTAVMSASVINVFGIQ